MKKMEPIQTVPTVAEMVNHFTMPNNNGKVEGFPRTWQVMYCEYMANAGMAKRLTDPEEIKKANGMIAHYYIVMIQMWKRSVETNGLWY